MANNRMFLVHKPSKIGIMLGKRMAYGWYKPPSQDEMQRFFEYIEHNPEGSQDDFVLAMEDCTESSCFKGWGYTAETIDGFKVFEIKE